MLVVIKIKIWNIHHSKRTVQQVKVNQSFIWMTQTTLSLAMFH